MRISVILPTYNEEKTIIPTLQALIRQDPDELIVADGGSGDKTLEIASRYARVIRSSKGRGRQMNAGAKCATGDILLFLHADTLLPEGGLEHVRMRIADGARAGRFRLCFDDQDFLLKLFQFYTRFQCFSYGDQGFFVTRNLFDQMAGFDEEAAFEDVEFYKRLRQQTKPVILKEPVITSARRFKAQGCLRQKWINLFLAGLYSAGFKVDAMKKKFYPDVR